MATKKMLPKVENGYELGADRYGYFSIIRPEERTINYIKNPTFLSNAADEAYKFWGTSYALCDYGYNYDNASGAIKDRDFSMTGGGAKISPTVNTLSKCTIYYDVTLPAGTYTASAYYSGGADHEFQFRVTNTSGTTQYGETAANFGTGLNTFQRIYVTFTIPTQLTARIHLSEFADSLGRLSAFYTDMWQCEDNPYVTQPFFGWRKIHDHDIAPGAYEWLGVPYYSESVRTDKAYESGRAIELSELGFKLTGIAGLGVNPINTVITPIASGGGIFDGSTDAPRTFTLIGRFYGSDLQDVLTKRRNLYELIRPSGRNTYDQPTTLIFRIWDCAKKNWTGQPLLIYCRYVSGLEGAIDSETSEDITITFTSEDPYIYSSYIKKYDITPVASYSQLVADTNKISPIFMLRDSDGVWTQIDIQLSDPTGLGRHADLCIVENVLPDGTGGYYIYGTFNTATYKGVSITVNKIFRYNKTTDTISALGTNVDLSKRGVSNGEVHKVIVIPSGDAIVVGSFTSVDGIANTACIAKYNPGANTWNSVSSGITGLGLQSAEIFDVEYANDDRIYVSGKFSAIGGLGTLPIEGIARMRCGDGVWSMLPVARTMAVYSGGVRLTRLYNDIKTPGYYPAQNASVSGFISGEIGTFNSPYTNGTVYWDGTETFYTNYRHVYRDDAEYPMNADTPAHRGAIDNDRGHFYFVDGNDSEIYKLQFVMPAHTKTNWSFDPAVDPYPRFSTTYTYPERDTPSIYHRLAPPFCRDVRVYDITFGDIGDGVGWARVPFAELRFSELKIINSNLVISPNFGYGLDAYELNGAATVPERNGVPLVWYLPLWKGNSSKFSYLDISSARVHQTYPAQSYTAAFDINFNTMEAFVVVNTGHISPKETGDNYIYVSTPVVKAITNNGEKTPFYFRVHGPATLGTFNNITTQQSIQMDGYHIPRYKMFDVVTLPANGSRRGDFMHSHMLDSSDANMYIAPGKNIMNCTFADMTQNVTAVSVFFRERYASIEKAIEYIGG